MTTYTGTSGPDYFYGSFEDNDVIDGGAGNDSLYGGKGTDTITGGAGDDILDGEVLVFSGNRDDYLIEYRARDAQWTITDRITGRDGTDSVRGDSFKFADVTLSSAALLASGDYGISRSGTDGADTLAGGAHNDVLYGGKGDDVLQGNGGDDEISGGIGTNTAVFRGNFADYSFSYDANLRRVTVTDQVAGRDGIDTLISIHQLQFADGVKPIGDVVDMTIPPAIIDSGGSAGGQVTYDDGDMLYGGKAGDNTQWQPPDLPLGVVDAYGFQVPYFPTVTDDSTLIHVTSETVALGSYALLPEAMQLQQLAVEPLDPGTPLFAVREDGTWDEHIVFNSMDGTLYYDVDGPGGEAAILFGTIDLCGMGFSWADYLVD